MPTASWTRGAPLRVGVGTAAAPGTAVDGAPPPTVAGRTETGPPAGADGFLAGVADELRWVVLERKGWLAGIGVNLVLAAAYVAWTHYRPERPDDVRVAGIATGVALWVLADVVNTNQLGDDADRVSGLWAGGRGVRWQLARKNCALAVLLLPLTVLVSVAVRLVLDRWRAIPHAVMLDVFVVTTWLGIGDLLSVLLPYRPLALRERLRRRRSWPRWLLCVAAPYLVLPAVDVVRWPADRLAHHLLGPPEAHLLGYAELYMCWGIVTWSIGLALAGAYAALAGRRLAADLRRPD